MISGGDRIYWTTMRVHVSTWRGTNAEQAGSQRDTQCCLAMKWFNESVGQSLGTSMATHRRRIHVEDSTSLSTLCQNYFVANQRSGCISVLDHMSVFYSSCSLKRACFSLLARHLFQCDVTAQCRTRASHSMIPEADHNMAVLRQTP